jgi:RNA polymerase sigma factor (sigma-70 family)
MTARSGSPKGGRKMADDNERKHAWIRDAFDRYEQPLLRYAVSIVGNVDSARDIVQDTFLRLWQTDPARLGAGLQAWLFTVCRHRALDVLKKEGRMGRLDESATAAAAVLGPDPDVLAGADAEQREVLRLLRTLPPGQQEVVRLRFGNELSYKEISEITGKTVTNVGYLLHTALATVREQIAERTGETTVAEGSVS